MPYELSFTRPLNVALSNDYVNECCYGGDVVVGELLPLVSGGLYSDIETNQEDWGWFLRLRRGDVKLEINVMCDDPAAGAFRVHLVSRRKRGWWRTTVVDTAELDELRIAVEGRLTEWTGAGVTGERI